MKDNQFVFNIIIKTTNQSIVSGLLIVFIAITCSSCLTQPQESLISDAPSQSGFSVLFSPENALVYINNEHVGYTPFTAEYQPGEVLEIEVSQENYLPYTTELSIPPSGNLIIRGHLIPEVSKQRIVNFGSHFGWLGDEFCFLSFDEETTLYCLEGDEWRELQSFEHLPFWIQYLNSRILVQDLDENSPVVFRINFNNNDVNNLIRGVFVTDYNQIQDQLFLFGLLEDDQGIYRNEMSLFTLSEDDELRQIMIREFPVVAFADGLSVSVKGDWLITSVLGETNLWANSDAEFVFYQQLEDVSSAKFSPGINTWLGMMADDGSLEFLDIDTQNRTLISKNVTSFSWMPDGQHIIFSRTSRENSSTLWMINLQSNVKRIIADAGIVLGEIVDLQVSRDGSNIAYANAHGRIEIISLNPVD